MAQKEIKKLIDGILNDKMELMVSKIDKIENNIVSQLEKLKQLNEFDQYTIPKDFELPGMGDAASKIDFLHNSIKKISAAENQQNLINSLLEGLNHFCSRAALFLVKDDKLVGWKGKGFSKHGGGIADEEIKKVFISISANTTFKRVLDKQNSYSGAHLSQPDDHLIYSRFGGEHPDSVFVLPFFVKGKPQAVIYTDAMAGKKIAKKEIEMISIVGEMSLDLLPLRQKLMTRVQTKKYVDESEEAAVIEPEHDEDEITLPSTKESDPERLARVIINDIILYNAQEVEEGRNNRNIYQTLEDTIMQAREQYLVKFSNIAVFERELVQTLARGDREALKGYKFEAI